MRWIRIALMAIALRAPSFAGAQEAAPPTPTEALLIQLRELVDAFEYREAVQLGANNAELIGRMRVDQLETYLILTAAANFPPDADSLQNREFALSALESLVRLKPDARIPVELSWDGLDALLNYAASRVFSVAVRPVSDYDLSGPEAKGYVTVVASRPTDFRLITLANGTEVIYEQDSVRTGMLAQLSFRIHDGARRLLPPGEVEFRVVARDVSTGDSTEVRFGALVTGDSPPPQALPVLDSALLLPVREPPRRASSVRTGIFYALVTGAIATAARAQEPLRSSFAIDARAFGVSAAMIGVAIAAAVRDTGRPLPQNVIVNDRIRSDHAAAVAAAVAENQRRSLQYRAIIRPQTAVAP